MVRENNYGPFTSMGKNLINHKWGSAVDDATNLLSGVSSNTGLTEKFVKGVLDKFLKEISENEESTPKEKKIKKDWSLQWGRGGNREVFEEGIFEDQKIKFAEHQASSPQKIKRWAGRQLREVRKHRTFLIFDTLSLLPCPGVVALSNGIKPLFNSFSSGVSNYRRKLEINRIKKNEFLHFDKGSSAEDVVKNRSLTIKDTAALSNDIGKNISGIGSAINDKLVSLFSAERRYRDISIYGDDDSNSQINKDAFIKLLNMDKDLTSISQLVDELEAQLFYLKLKVIVGNIYCVDEFKKNPCTALPRDMRF